MSNGVWFAVGILALVTGWWVAAKRQSPVVEEREVTTLRPLYESKKTLMDVETADGKIIKAFVPETVQRTVEVKQKEQFTREPTPEQRLRLNMLMGAGGIIAVFLVGLMLLWFYLIWMGKNVPKSLEDWLKYLVSGVLGAVLGFLGAPPGETQVKQGPAAAESPSAVRIVNR
jgi:hypothetical protein